MNSASSSTLERFVQALVHVPAKTWWNWLAWTLIVLMIIRIWRSLRSINEFIPYIVVVLIGGSVILYWTYERSEPHFLSPAISILAKFLPSKIPMPH